MATTANYGFPSPEGTAPPQGPYAIKSLADAIDAFLFGKLADTGWVDVTVAGGFSPQAGNEKPQVRKIGNTVYLRGGWLSTGMAANGSYSVGTLPAGFRPPINTVGTAGSSTGEATCTLHLTAAGDCNLRISGTLGAYYKMDRQSFLVD